MKRIPSFRLAAVALMAASMLVLLGSAAPERGAAQSDALPFYDGEGPVAPGYERSAVPPALEGVTLKEPPGKAGKLSWHLAQLAQAGREAQTQGQAITARTPSLLPKNLRDLLAAGLMRINEGGEVQVYVGTGDPGSAAAHVTLALGGRIERQDAALGITQAWLPIAALDDLAADPAVRFVRLPNYGFVQTGSVLSEGDAALNADDVRSSFGVDGTGVKVGVISDSVKGLAASQGSGDLPPAVNIIDCNVVGGDPTATFSGEGTAMLEIVHDLAPGAELWFGYFGMGTSLEFNAAVNCLAQNADVVIDDIAWFNAGPYDGTSAVSQNTADALNHVGWPIRGYFNAVANQADKHYQELYWDADADDWHDFSQTVDTTDVFGLGTYPLDPLYLYPDMSVCVYLQWNDPWGASSNNYDVYLFREPNFTTPVDGSEEWQDGDDDPVERFCYTNEGSEGWFDIAIGKFAGSPKTFDMFVLFPQGCVRLGSSTGPCHNYNTAASSVPNNSDAGGSPVPIMSLGAIDQADSGHDDIEYFSSRGPTNAPSPRTKPDATAIDGVCVTGAGGFGQGSCQTTGKQFFGTSAAAPHAGGIAALLLQCAPSLDRAGLRSALLTTAVDLLPPGTDNTFGAGRLDALDAAMSGVCPDPDGDQLTDVIDNCPDDYNPGQEDIGDGDGVGDACDNCPSIANPGQLNSDSGRLGIGDPKPDRTNAHSDTWGDTCDDDDDNDWLTDADEVTHSTTTTNPDTDGDRLLDGAEVHLLGSSPLDPNDPPSLPSQCTAPGDSDADNLKDAMEYCVYATSGSTDDTDGDTCEDLVEVLSLNGDNWINLMDLYQLAPPAWNAMPGEPGWDPNKDLDGNRWINLMDIYQLAPPAWNAFCPGDAGLEP